MKIAIALFGIPRASEITMPTIEENFIEPASKAGECRVFYHLFKIEQLNNPRSGESGLLEARNYNWFDQYQGTLEKPENCLERWPFERLKMFGDFHNDGFRSLKNLVHQLHSLNEVTNMVQQYDADVVFFLRPDLHYEASITAKEIKRLSTDPLRCVIPEWEWWNGYNDRFAFCGKQSFTTYGSRITRAIEFCQEVGEALQGERLVRYSLNRSNVKVRLTTLPASRIRVSGQFQTEYFGPFHSIWHTEIRREWLKLKFQSLSWM